MLRNEPAHRKQQENNLQLEFQLGDGDMQQNCIATYKFANDINRGLSPKKEHNIAKNRNRKF